MSIVVWIDHVEARVLHLQPDTFDETTVWAPQPIHNKHPRPSHGIKPHPDDAKQYFHELARSLGDTDSVLVVGPSTAKLEFIRYLHKHDAALEKRIVGVETVDHPSDGQLAAFAKTYFHLSPRATPATAGAPGAAPAPAPSR